MITWNCDRDGEIKGQGCGNKTDLVVMVVRGKAIFEETTCESQRKRRNQPGEDWSENIREHAKAMR